ncbi:hypothetical protein SAMN05421847_0593 [Halpernia humi]|uniref:Uncharacterized protein n=1 Tax=Halpernia humi TaxID=493375 RepID=A0A1H5TW90_9FLAO|nr:hypothetical protein [Halpernia humi]SEF67094.1 hypothetical protein SAMN05421847_0593 [Halpernia humi]
MELHLKIIGALLIVLALVHVIFPRYFKWKVELQNLSLVNRQMTYIHTFFIALTVFLMGILCLTSDTDLVETSFGKRISLGLGIFWGIRFFIQFFVYSSQLWRGKTFETVVHIVFSILWAYFTIVFFRIYLI